MEGKERGMSVLMLPFVAHSHISPYLGLAKKLATRNIRVYFCSTKLNLEPIHKKLSPQESVWIELVELQLPSSPRLPPESHTSTGLPRHLKRLLRLSLHKSAPSLSRILQALKPDVLIYDYLHTWATHLASEFCIPAVEFMTGSASALSYFLHLRNRTHSEYPFPEINLSAFYKHKYLAMSRITGAAVEEGRNLTLIRSFREIEGKYLDDINANPLGKRIVPVGPLFSDPAQGEDGQDTGNCCDIYSRWLDRKGPSSTVLVSFGSEYFSPMEELEEIANALELSRVNFVWVIRSPTSTIIGVERHTGLQRLLPDGFIERVGERGLVVEGWAPQTRILAHPSIVGFVSHCGWGSVLESIKFGVPIIAMPQLYDQPVNAKLVMALGIGLEVTRDERNKYRRGEIVKVINKVVVEEDGKEMKRNAADLSQEIVNKGDEDVDEVVKELVHFCKGYSKL